jgi:hypothetical protein
MIPPRSVLAATDFSEGSRAAVTFAACLAKHSHATFHLLHAEDPLLAAAAREAGIDLAGDTRQALQDFVASVRPAADYAPMHHVVCGPAAEVIEQRRLARSPIARSRSPRYPCSCTWPRK